jgi:hypothetical protein
VEKSVTPQKTPPLVGFHNLFSLGAFRSSSHKAQILPFFNHFGGKFVEIGAQDGVKDSFTLYLEKALGWKGVLIEPWPHLFHKCRKARKQSLVLNVAVVDHWLEDSFIEVRGTPPKASIQKALRKEASERLVGKTVEAPFKRPKQESVSYVTTDLARNILNRAEFDHEFELLVLNLQGYENHALEGLDFDRYRPNFILAKVGNRLPTLSNLPASYELVSSSRHDERTMLRLYRNSKFGDS